VKANRVRALGVTLQQRSPSLPGIPTIAEAGVPGYRFDAWQSIVVPAGTPKAIVDKVHADVLKILALPEVKERLVDQGANELVGSSPEEFGRMIRAEIERYRKLIADARIVVQQ
jgi:tripartite-type tricarboxylate transporter receptor subunit TctC